MTYSEMLSGVVAHDKEAEERFVSLILSFRPLIAANLQSRRNRADDIADATQRLVLRLFQAARAGEIRRPEALPKLIVEAARLECLSFGAKERQRDARSVQLPQSPTVASRRIDPERVAILRERVARKLEAFDYAWEQLNSRRRECLEWKYIEGLSDTEIGKRVGGTYVATNLVHNGKKAIAASVRKYQAKRGKG